MHCLPEAHTGNSQQAACVFLSAFRSESSKPRNRLILKAALEI